MLLYISIHYYILFIDNDLIFSFSVLCCFVQPLMDNLESQTYEVFEKDPVKYSQYQLVRPSDTSVTDKSVCCKSIK